jgi:iron(III) transport system substrate-binding protein
MASTLIRERWKLALALLVLVVVLLSGAIVLLGGDKDLVVYNGRSQYGSEKPFTDFEDREGLSIELRGGTAPELFERLKSEGDRTPADVLVTTDLANLWRAKQAGLLQPIDSAKLDADVPAALRDPDKQFWGLSLRLRTPVRSTERVPANAVTSYEDLGDARFKGRLCLRTSNNEYNQSLVADMIAKRGAAQTERLLRSWMDNDPRIEGSDVQVLEAIAANRCDVGLVNHYYLGRILKDKPDFPVTPAWPDQDGAGVHANLSGAGVVRWSEHRANAIKLIESLTEKPAQESIVENSEFAANRDVPPPAHIRAWAKVKTDPIDVSRAGKLLPDAVAMMQRVGWK